MRKYIFLILFLLWMTFSVKGANPVKEQFEEFEKRFECIEDYDDIAENSFRVIENQVFTEIFESFGNEPVNFVPALSAAQSFSASKSSDTKSSGSSLSVTLDGIDYGSFTLSNSNSASYQYLIGAPSNLKYHIDNISGLIAFLLETQDYYSKTQECSEKTEQFLNMIYTKILEGVNSRITIYDWMLDIEIEKIILNNYYL